MGVFSEHEKKKHDKAYERGRRDAEKATLIDDLVHGVGEIVGTVVPSTSEHKSYEQGWRDQKSGKNKR